MNNELNFFQEISKENVKILVRHYRMKLANWLWPKDVQEGELFTILQHLNETTGRPNGDGSWVGKTLRADIVKGDNVFPSEFKEGYPRYNIPPSFDPLTGYVARPGKNCVVRPLSVPLSKEQSMELYARAKGR